MQGSGGEPKKPKVSSSEESKSLSYPQTIAAAVTENKLCWSRAALGYRATSRKRQISFCGISLRTLRHFAEQGSLPWLPANHMIASLPRSVGEQPAQTVMEREDAFLPSMFAFPEQTYAALSRSDLPT